MQQHEWVHRGKTSDAQNFIREYVKEKRKYGDYAVIDIGGGLGNWAQDFSDLCLDMNPMNNEKAISGDVYDESTWNGLPLEKFDMAILSHILEDVRDPFFLIEKALKLADKIFVSVPSIQLEFSKI